MSDAAQAGGLEIASIGHGSRTQEEMRRLILARGITCIVDVRRFPTSRKFPHFGAEAMREWLSQAGVRYVPMGDSLGGFRTGGYEAWMRTPRFQAGLSALADLARRERQAGGLVAFMCSERLPWRCHRRFIARALVEAGWQVLHIIDERRNWAGPAADATPSAPRT